MKSVLDEEKVITAVNKLEMFQKEENLNLDAFDSLFKNLSTYYQTSNSESFDSKVFELTQKFNIINKLHNNDVYVLNKNVENYKNTKIVVENILDNIN